MSIDPKLLLSNFAVIMASLCLLIGGKTILVALVGRIFGISSIAAIRVGLLLAPGGEFAFVAFGEAVNQVYLSRPSTLYEILFSTECFAKYMIFVHCLVRFGRLLYCICLLSV